MGLLSGSGKRLPLTTYGYLPPANATASGWQCNNADCGTGDVPAPRKWPAACPLCGGQVDPDFNEPWREDARGFRLMMLIEREGDEFGIYGGSLREWKYAQELAAGDIAGARDILAEATSWLDHKAQQSVYFNAASTRFMLVNHALRYSQIDSAADILVAWFRARDVYNLDTTHLGDSEGSPLRADCFSLFRSALAFMQHPAAAAHVWAGAIDKAVRHLGAATQHEMPGDLRHQYQTLLRTPSLPATAGYSIERDAAPAPQSQPAAQQPAPDPLATPAPSARLPADDGVIDTSPSLSQHTCPNAQCSNYRQPVQTRQCPACFHYART